MVTCTGLQQKIAFQSLCAFLEGMYVVFDKPNAIIFLQSDEYFGVWIFFYTV